MGPSDDRSRRRADVVLTVSVMVPCVGVIASLPLWGRVLEGLF